jgi:hydrogenase expression/formation protein HypC
MSTLGPTTLACSGEHCITCADEAVPMTVVRLDELRGLALCADADGARHTVEIALVDRLSAGDTVLVHAGVAIASPAEGVAV